MGRFADLLGVMQSTFRVGRAVIVASALTAQRTLTLPDRNVTLGTAADRDATTSATDTTSERLWRTNDLAKQTGPMDETDGSVLLRGAFGCGARIPTTYNSSNPLYITDFAAYRPTGVYLATGDGVSPASANAPPGSGNNQLLVSAWSSVSATQYFVIANSASAANKRAWIGNYYGTANYAWAELWHSGNLVVGTSGNAVGKLNTANTWSAAQAFTTITASAGSVIGNNQIGANALELGINASGDRPSFVDLHADDTNTDYSGRLLRNAGVNGTLDLLNVGTGATRLNSAGGPVQLLHQGNTRLATTAAGVDITGIVNSYGLSPLVTVSATSKTFALADAGTYQRFTAGSNATCTVPTNASVAYPIGSEIHIRRAANANLTIVPASGAVTIEAPSGGSLVLTKGMTVTLKKVGVDSWDLIGQTVAA